MTDEEKTELIRFLESPRMYDAIRKFFTLFLEKYQFEKGYNISNEQLGANVRAQLEGKELLDKAFKAMEKLKPDSPQKIKLNEAR